MKCEKDAAISTNLRNAFGEVPEGVTKVLHQTLDRIKDEPQIGRTTFLQLLHNRIKRVKHK